ncbi:MAG: TIR domain-containing protein [Pseudomonadota bacterium]|uniref:TIR domain-containing protein n=1 Tax=Phenylobacterium sp. TaxID=1871053 RepID=UPI0025F95E60|nr:TIR domain-containing protein [Phenylobacterium sp.]
MIGNASSGELIRDEGELQMAIRRHVFISHHHADDETVSKLTGLMHAKSYEIRNSSIRAKPANQARIDKGLISERVIRRLLRMKMRWASTVVVIIGKETASRPWVNWEIETAYRLGKRIVGVYERGGTENDVPEAFKSYGDTLVSWNSASIMDAIEGRADPMEKPDGQQLAPRPGARKGCAA